MNLPASVLVTLLADPIVAEEAAQHPSSEAETTARSPGVVFPRGPTFGFGAPVVGGMTLLSERRSALTLGFSLEGGYMFAPRDRRLRVWLGGSWLREQHLLLGGRSSRFEWQTKLRLGGVAGRTFAYALLGVGPSIGRVRDEDGRHKTVQPAATVGAGLLWAVGERTALGVEADVGASARSRSDAQLRWSARLTMMFRFGCSKKHR